MTLTGERFTIVCVSQHGLSKAFQSHLQEAIARLRLNPTQFQQTQHGDFAVAQLNASSQKNLTAQRFKDVLTPLSEQHRVDILALPEGEFRTPKKLIAFDMDSTLIEAEVIDEMAKAYGVGDAVQAITKRAMNGEMNFDQSLRERLALLKGMPKPALLAIYERIGFTAGTEEFLQRAHAQGIKTAIISGGFNFFAEKFRARLGMNWAFANELKFDGEIFTGEVTGEILNAEKKRQIVTELAHQEQLSLSQIAAVGDGANDLPMLAAAGLGVAIHGKELVRREAQHTINHGPMTTLLFYLGIPYGHV